MFDTIQNSLPFITGGLIVLALLLFAVSLRSFQRSRTDTYWRRRRDAGQRGLRLFLTAFALFIASGVACLLTLLVTMIDENNEPTATPDIVAQLTEAAPTATPENSDTGTATAAPTITPAISDVTETTNEPDPTTPAIPEDTPTPANTPTPVIVVVTATPMNTPTHTPFPTFAPHVSPPPLADVTPDTDASLTITALDDRISDIFEPVNPRTTFTEGTRRIYFFVEFENMSQGVLWKRALLKDGITLDSSTYTWRMASEGTTYFFLGSDEGFAPGQYEIRLFIGSGTEPATTSRFTVLPAP